MSGMDAVHRKTAETGSEIEKLNQKKQVFSQLGTAALGFGAAAAAGVGIAISRFAEFDQQMSYVQAATHETASNMNLLRDAALEAGARTVYSATEAAGAIEELAKAGVSTADILKGGLDGALDLAAAGGLDVAQAAGIAATALKTFGLEGKDMSHVADLLAAGAGKAMGDVTDLSQALAQGGLVAKATGLSLEETTAALAAFAAQGLLGSDAGTSLKTMLQRLTPQSKEAKDQFDALGISAYDANGQFVGLADFAGQLRDKMKDLTPEARNAAMSVMFGSDAVRAANVLYEEGAKGIEDWTAAVDDQGYAAETARQRLDNLKGDLERLGGAFDTALIQSGSGANESLRALTKTATGLVDMFSDLPAPVIEWSTYLAAATAGVGLLGGAALVATPRIAEFRALLRNTSLSMGGLSLAAVGVTAGLTALIAIVAAAAQAQADARARAEAYADALDQGATAARKFVAEQLSAKDSFMWLDRGSAIDNAKKLGISIDEVTKAVTGSAAEFAKFKDRVQDAYDTKGQGVEYGVAMQQLTEKVEQLRVAQSDAAQKAKETEAAQKALTGATLTGASSADELAEATQAATSNLDDLKAALEGVGGTAMSMGEAVDAAQRSINDLVEAAAAEGVTLEGTNDASLDFRDTLRDVEQSHRDAASAILYNNGTMEDARAEWGRGRDAILNQLEAMLGSRDAAIAWADQNLGSADAVTRALAEVKVAADAIPAGKTINLQVAGYSETYQYLSNIQAVLRSVTGNNTIRIATGAGGQGGLVAGNAAGGMYDHGDVVGFAGGGIVVTGSASGIYNGRVGGLYRFAEGELGVPWESIISGRVQDRGRNVRIWEETGERLGVWDTAPVSARSWQSAPAPVLIGVPGGAGREITVDQSGSNFYSYDPTAVAREAREQLGRALDAAGV